MSHYALWWIGATAIGAVVGSFLNVVMARWPRGESLIWPGSHCPACGRAIRPWHNVPVLSWLALRGRCWDCRARIPIRYLGVEVTTTLVFAALAWRFDPSAEAVLAMIFAAALIAAAGIDFDCGILPDGITVGGLLLCLSVVPAVRVWEGAAAGPTWGLALLGAATGGGMFWTVGFAHARLCAAQGRRFPHWPGEEEDFPGPWHLDYWIWFPGIGFGDIKLFAMIGAFLGPWGVLETAVAASLLGLLFGLGHALWKGDWEAPFGFGPPIAMGSLLALLTPSHPFLQVGFGIP